MEDKRPLTESLKRNVDETEFESEKCNKLESEIKTKRSEFKTSGKHSSGYSSADYSDFAEMATFESGTSFPDDRMKANELFTADQNHLNSSSTSDTESSVDEIEEDEYRIERREERVMRIKPSRKPTLYSHISTLCDENSFVFARNENVTSTDQTDCIQQPHGHQCSANTSPTGYEIVQRRSEYLKVNKTTDFCKIQTVIYRYDNQEFIQHYKKNLRPEEKDIEGKIGLSEGDLLLEVNGKALINIPQKHVLKIFKKIESNPSDGCIFITLLYRRWETRKCDGIEQEFEVDYELKLKLEPVFTYEGGFEQTLERETSLPSESGAARPLVVMRVNDNNRTRSSRYMYRVSSEDTSTVELNKKLLPIGNIDHIKPLAEKRARIKCPMYGPDEFLTSNINDKVTLSVPMSSTKKREIFSIEEFTGEDTSAEPLSHLVFCIRVQSSEESGRKFLSSQIKKRDQFLCFQPSVPKVTFPNDIDESCFIKREIGNKVMLESLLTRGCFVGCKKTTGGAFRLAMVRKSYEDLQKDKNLEDIKFEFYYIPSNTCNTMGEVERLVNRFANWTN